MGLTQKQPVLRASPTPTQVRARGALHEPKPHWGRAWPTDPILPHLPVCSFLGCEPLKPLWRSGAEMMGLSPCSRAELLTRQPSLLWHPREILGRDGERVGSVASVGLVCHLCSLVELEEGPLRKGAGLHGKCTPTERCGNSGGQWLPVILLEVVVVAAVCGPWGVQRCPDTTWPHTPLLISETAAWTTSLAPGCLPSAQLLLTAQLLCRSLSNPPQCQGCPHAGED